MIVQIQTSQKQETTKTHNSFAPSKTIFTSIVAYSFEHFFFFFCSRIYKYIKIKRKY